MITVIVVDDENIARRRLVRLLEETGEAKVVAECAGGRDAVARIPGLTHMQFMVAIATHGAPFQGQPVDRGSGLIVGRSMTQAGA